jgi:pimeloyl-ACP methyl ester carboxylesterase
MTTWILLRGLTREARHWGALPAALSDALTDARVLTVDLPGNGEYAHLRAPSNVPDMVGFVRAALQERGVRGPCNVLAMSLGGMVATCWAQHHPDEISRLVLINTSMRPFSRFDERLRPEAWPRLLRIARHWGAPAVAEASIHRLTCNNADTRPADLKDWAAIRASAPVSRANALRQLLAAARFSAGRHKPGCAALVLSSREDRLVNPVCSATLAAAWGAEHWRHPWAGHDLPHDDAAWTVEQVRNWLAQASARD